MAINNLGLTAKGFIMIKELIRLANELDSKGLTKEADTLDSIIKEAQRLDSRGVTKEASVSRWLAELFGAGEATCAQRTAAAMGMLPDHARESAEGCERAGYEYDVDDNTKIDIVEALKRLIKNNSDPEDVFEAALKKYLENHTEHTVSFYEVMAKGRGVTGITEFVGIDFATSNVLGLLKAGLKERLIDGRTKKVDKYVNTPKVDRQGQQI